MPCLSHFLSLCLKMIKKMFLRPKEKIIIFFEIKSTNTLSIIKKIKILRIPLRYFNAYKNLLNDNYISLFFIYLQQNMQKFVKKKKISVFMDFLLVLQIMYCTFSSVQHFGIDLENFTTETIAVAYVQDLIL